MERDALSRLGADAGEPPQLVDQALDGPFEWGRHVLSAERAAETAEVQAARDRPHPLGLELLCTKAGEGAISVGETILTVKGAKPLPASD